MMLNMSIEKNKLQWLLSPWTLIISVILGVLLGTYFKGSVVIYKEIGKMFLDLLTMCVIPILITAVSTSIANIIRHHHSGVVLLLMLLAIIVTLTFSGLIGIVAGIRSIIHGSSHIDASTRAAIGNLLLSSDTKTIALPSHVTSGFGSFISRAIPQNLIYAMAHNNSLSLLTFSVLFGLVIGYARGKAVDSVYQIMQGIFELFLKLINAIIYILPLGLMALISEQVATTGFNLFSSLGNLILHIYLGCILISIIFLIIISLLTKRSIIYTVKNLRNVMLMAFASSSGFATLPFALTSLEEKFSANKETIGLFLPFNICLNPSGSVFSITLFVIYMAVLYGIKLSFLNYIVILFGCILTAIAMGSIPAIAAASVLAIVLTPLGIPLKTSMILMISVANFIDPIMTLTNILGNCALSLGFEKLKLYKD